MDIRLKMRAGGEGRRFLNTFTLPSKREKQDISVVNIFVGNGATELFRQFCIISRRKD